MATKTANLYARIEPETKYAAESILDTLGIPASVAINLFYKQIILRNGLPFEVQIPTKAPLNLAAISEDEFNSEMEKSYKSMRAGKGVSAKKAFAKIKRSLYD